MCSITHSFWQTMESKLKLFIIFLVFLGLFITVWKANEQKKTRSKAMQTARLSFSTPNVNVGVLQEIPVSILIDSPTTAVAGFDVIINYPADKLAVQTVHAATFLPVVLVPPQTTSGTTRIVLASKPGQAKEGSGILVTLTFKTLTRGQATVVIDPKTKLALVGQSQNALGELNSLTLSIDSAPIGRPNPTIPTATSTISPSPTPTSPSPTRR